MYAVTQLLEPERYPTVAALAGVDQVLAALARITEGSLDEHDHALAVDQWDCAHRLAATLEQIGLGNVVHDHVVDARGV